MSAPYLGGWFVCMFYVQCNKESKNDILCLEMCTFTSENLIDITKFIIGEETVKSFKQFMNRLFDVIFEIFSL